MFAEEAPAFGGGVGRRGRGGLDAGRLAGRIGGEAGGNARLHVENLQFSVSEQDLWDLFGSVGTVQKVFMHYDRAGRSQGTADVTMTSRAAAANAIRKYNGVALDGEALSIAFAAGAEGGAAGGFARAPRVVASTARAFGAQSYGGGFGGGFGSFRARGRGARGGARGGRGGRGGRGRGGRSNGAPVSETDLDAELEQYASNR